MKKKPLLSIIIPNHNSQYYLKQCLTSIYDLPHSSFEVIVVDNASSDQSLQHAKKFNTRPNFTLIQNFTNQGAAQARNTGAKTAISDYLFFLDSDTTLKADCLSKISQYLKANSPDHILHPMLLSMEDKKTIDCAGNYLDSFGFLNNRGTGQIDSGQFNHSVPILAGKSAAIIIPRQIFHQIGGFDPDFHFLLEDTDLDWRAWLAGFSVVTLPQAIVYHGFNTTTKNQGDFYHPYAIQYLGSRNYLQTLIKNLDAPKVITTLPLHLASWTGLAFISLFRLHPRRSFQILSGVIWNIIFLPKTLAKRHHIQSTRKSSPNQLQDLWISHQSFSSYMTKISLYTK